MNAVDTNILIYINDPRDPIKQGIASTLVSSLTDGALLWQVACEYLAASRKLEPLSKNLNPVRKIFLAVAAHLDTIGIIAWTKVDS